MSNSTLNSNAQIYDAHILLVEDNELIQEAIAWLLTHAGAKVGLARNGREAIELLRNIHFDCVLMDVQMPVMDGYEATKLIRSESAFDDMPIIAITSDVSMETHQRCVKVGMNDFIHKPFKHDKFFTKLGQWLSHPPRRSEREKNDASSDPIRQRI